MSVWEKISNLVTMITLFLVTLVTGILAMVFLTTSFRDNNLYRFCSGIGITWVAICIGRATKEWLDNSGDW